MLTDAQRSNAERKAMEVLNKMAADYGLFPRQPSYRYYLGKHFPNNKHTESRYFWTTEKLNRNGHKRYVAGIYRYLKSKKQYKIVIERSFAKKYRAKERAHTWAIAGR